MRSPISMPLLAMLLGFVLVVLFTHFTIIDDAYISFRYADNLANHGELVFNAHERVEGMTNLLWTLVLSAVALLRLPVEEAAVWLSLACLLHASFRLCKLGPNLGSTPWAGTIAALFLILNPNYIGATTNGMEGALFSALLAEAVYRFACSHHKRALTAASLLFLTRPEGIVFALLLLCVICFEYRSLRNAMLYSLYVAVPALGVTVFRLLYYGSLIQNSVIAKSISLRMLPWYAGLSIPYFRGFCTTTPYLAVVALASVLWLLRDGRRNEKASLVAVLSLGTIIFSWVVVIRNAGDWMPYYRLLTQYGVLYSALLIVLLRKQIVSNVFALALLAYPLVQTVVQTIEQGYKPPFSISAQFEGGFWDKTTTRLKPVLAENDRVSAEALGYISYNLPRIPFHDPCGLTDPYLARHGKIRVWYGKQDSTYTLGTIRPSVMVWHWSGHMRGVAQTLLDQYITLSPMPPNGWDTDVVMIRTDRFEKIGATFSDWHRVRLETDSIGPYDSNKDK